MMTTGAIFKEVLRKGIHETGDVNTTNYTHYSYTVHPELKQFTIIINAADLNFFSGSTLFEKTHNRNTQLKYSLISFKNEFLGLLLVEREDYVVNNENHTITIKENGYHKLLAKKDFPELLIIVTLIFSLQNGKPHEVASIIYDILNNKHSCFRIIRNTADNSAYELYAGGGRSENLSKQIRDAFRTAAVTMLNLPDTEKVKIPVKEEQLPDQLNNSNQLSGGFSKFIFLSKYMFDLLVKESNKIKFIIPEPEVEEEKKSRSRIKFADTDEKSSLERTNEKNKTMRIEPKKRRSLALSVQINVTDENREAWNHAISTGLLADMDDLLPADNEAADLSSAKKVVTIENKYEVCQKLENFFIDREKINNIKLINLLFLGLIDFKDVINVHKNEKIDALLFKKNTDSWQKLLKSIRNRAYELLEEEAARENDDLKAITLLKPYLDKDIFKIHRSNAFFMKVGKTSTIKKIELLIEQRENSYVEKSKQSSSLLQPI